MSIATFRHLLALAVFMGLLAFGPLSVLDLALPGLDHHTGPEPLTAQGHLNFWQQLLLPTPRLLGALLPLLVAMSLVFFGREISALLVRFGFHVQRRLQQAPAPFGYSYLLESLSAGILHPKTY